MEEYKKVLLNRKTIKVCKECNNIGHNSNSVNCPIYIENKNNLIKKVKKYFLSNDIFEERPHEELIIELSEKLCISQSYCKTLYREIPLTELLNRPITIDKYFSKINENQINCSDCKKTVANIYSNIFRKWKDKLLCDSCWFLYNEERERIWKLIKKHKKTKCVICDIVKKNDSERYHYDHINMFDKSSNVSNMINQGEPIKMIFKEIDKCQIVCLECHHKITDIECKFGFTKLKQKLTRDFNDNNITKEEYENQKKIYEKIYQEKMMEIYKKLRIYIISQKNKNKSK